MQFTYLLGGGTPVIKKYKMAAAVVAGAMVLPAAANATGLSTSTTTSWAHSMGIALDAILAAGSAIVYSTTQGQPEYIQSIIVNPDAVLRALLVGSATDAIMVNNPILTASAAGLTHTGTNTVSNEDEGTIWYSSGANVGQSRKITSVSTAVATVIMPFLYGNAVGDVFLSISQTPGSLGTTMGTTLLNVRTDNVALGSDTAALCVDLELRDNNNSYIHLLSTTSTFLGN